MSKKKKTTVQRDPYGNPIEMNNMAKQGYNPNQSMDQSMMGPQGNNNNNFGNNQVPYNQNQGFNNNNGQNPPNQGFNNNNGQAPQNQGFNNNNP